MADKDFRFKLSAVDRGALSLFNRTRNAIGRVNEQMTKLKYLNRHLMDTQDRIARVGAASHGFNRQMTNSGAVVGAANKQTAAYNKSLKEMSQVSQIGGRNVRAMSSDFDQFSMAMSRFRKFDPIVSQTRDAKGRYAGPHMVSGIAHKEAVGVPGGGMASTAVPPGTASFLTGMSGKEYGRLQGQIGHFSENLLKMNKEASDIAKVFGSTTMATSKMNQVLGAFSKPNMINVEKMARGDGAGMYRLMGAQGPLAGTPNFTTEQEAKRFVSAVGDMRKGMEKTTKTNEQMNRRQGVSFMQLLSLMVKFGIAMQLIQMPGKVIQKYEEIRSTSIGLQHQAAKTTTLVPGLQGIQKEYVQELAKITASIPIVSETGKQAMEIVAKTGTELASSLENIPLEKGRMYGDKWFDRESATLVKLTEIANNFGLAALEDDPSVAIKAITRVSGPLKIPITSTLMNEFMDQMLATIDFGDVRGGQLADFIGEAMGPFTSLWGERDRGTQEKAFKEMLTIFGTMTTTLSPEESATGWRNMMKSIMDPPKEVRRDLISLKEKHGIDLTFGALVNLGYTDYFKRVESTIGTQGTWTDKFIQSKAGQKEIDETMKLYGGDREMAEENVRAAKSQQYVSYLYGNIRGLRGFEAAMIDGGAALDRFTLAMDKLTEGDLMGRRLDTLSDTLAVKETEQRVSKEIIDQKLFDPEKQDAIATARILQLRENLDKEGFDMAASRIMYSIQHDIPVLRDITAGSAPNRIFYKNVSDALKKGVNPAAMSSHFEAQGISIPGLKPGKQGFREWAGNQLFGADPSKSSWEQVTLSGTPRKRILEGWQATDPKNRPWPVIDFESMYEPGSGSHPLPLLDSESMYELGSGSHPLRPIRENETELYNQDTGMILQGDLIIHVNVEGGANPQEDGEIAAQAFIEEISEILDTESNNQEASIRTLHRNFA